jgi:hypothetical protein
MCSEQPALDAGQADRLRFFEFEKVEPVIVHRHQVELADAAVASEMTGVEPQSTGSSLGTAPIRARIRLASGHGSRDLLWPWPSWAGPSDSGAGPQCFPGPSPPSARKRNILLDGERTCPIDREVGFRVDLTGFGRKPGDQQQLKKLLETCITPRR